ncbi:MAG: ATP-binding cassette domain-containing protein, partial [Thermoplasmata archaeon]|nr:ATP-binding cassette domain-containing protein [Thermoplasmata archaeon]
KVVIVGANGSGKSTLLKVALGLAPVSEGSVRVLGRDVRTVRGETGVGTNLEEVYRLMTISVDGLISIWSRLKGGSEEEIRHWIDDFHLQGVLDRPLFRLSTGQAKLVGNLLALAFRPRLLLLDEPFDNVDFGRRRQYVALLAQSPAAVAMNTHELELLHSFPEWGLYFMFEGQLIGRFRAADIDRLYLSRGRRADAVASFRTSIGEVAVTLDLGDTPMKGASNLSYLLDRIS